MSKADGARHGIASRPAVAAGIFVLISAMVAGLPATVLAEDVGKSMTIEFQSPQLVTVDGARLTEAELDSFLYEIPEGDRTQFVASARRIAETIESLISRQLLARRAIEDGLLDDTQFNATLYRKAVSLISSEYLARVAEPKLLDDYTQRAREIYLTEPDRFRTPARYSFSHLLIRTAERSEPEAMKQILELHDRVRNGEDFDALVEEYSEDTAAAERGGSYTEVPPDSLDDNFANALGRLDQVGTISEPVRTRFGWHLIRLDQAFEPETREWQEAADDARRVARRRHEEQIRKEVMSELMSGAVEATPGIVESFQRRHGYDPDALSGSSEQADDSDRQP